MIFKIFGVPKDKTDSELPIVARREMGEMMQGNWTSDASRWHAAILYMLINLKSYSKERGCSTYSRYGCA
jgi:hypothetical protein